MNVKNIVVVLLTVVIMVGGLYYYFVKTQPYSIPNNQTNYQVSDSELPIENFNESKIVETSDTDTPTTENIVPVQPPTVKTTNQPVPTVPIETKKTTSQTVMKIQSDAFVNNGRIPEQYTCNGGSQIPTLNISGVPTGAKTLAIIMDDPDAPGGTYVHWVIWNIDASTSSLGDGNIPSSAVEGYNSDNKGWYPPCPPSGTHHYNFKLYALDTVLDISDSSTKSDLVNAMTGHILTTATLTGLYGN